MSILVLELEAWVWRCRVAGGWSEIIGAPLNICSSSSGSVWSCCGRRGFTGVPFTVLFIVKQPAGGCSHFGLAVICFTPTRRRRTVTRLSTNRGNTLRFMSSVDPLEIFRVCDHFNGIRSFTFCLFRAGTRVRWRHNNMTLTPSGPARVPNVWMQWGWGGAELCLSEKIVIPFSFF